MELPYEIKTHDGITRHCVTRGTPTHPAKSVQFWAPGEDTRDDRKGYYLSYTTLQSGHYAPNLRDEPYATEAELLEAAEAEARVRFARKDARAE